MLMALNAEINEDAYVLQMRQDRLECDDGLLMEWFAL